MIKAILEKSIGILVGKQKYQKFFEFLHQLSLSGMNIGGGTDADNSGEKVALHYIKDRFSNKDKLIIFDVGANVGHYSILLNEIFGHRAKIFSFEPSRRTFDKLYSNIANFSNITPYNLGFGSKDAKLALYTNAEESVLASVYQRRLDHFDLQLNISEEISITTLNSFCKENSIEHINLLKLDVEGHEIEALRGASEIIGSGKVDFIQFEFGGCNIDSRTYFQDFFYILKDNYTIYRIVKDGLYKIEQYKEAYEAFIATNYLAEKK